MLSPNLLYICYHYPYPCHFKVVDTDYKISNVKGILGTGVDESEAVYNKC